jgi:outer membrane protein insertion porin family
MRSKRASAIARRHHLHRQQGRPEHQGLRAQFAVKDGEWFNAPCSARALEQLRKAYGELGYINFVGTPVPRIDEAKKLIYLDIDIDEGKPFYVSRIEFTGNTSPATRSSAASCCSKKARSTTAARGSSRSAPEPVELLRRTLKAGAGLREPPECRRRHRRPAAEAEGKGQELHRPERRYQRSLGKLHRPELRDQQLPGPRRDTLVQANIGDLSRNLSLGFTEPYLRNKPISLGFQVFSSQVRLQPREELCDLHWRART